SPSRGRRARATGTATTTMTTTTIVTRTTIVIDSAQGGADAWPLPARAGERLPLEDFRSRRAQSHEQPGKPDPLEQVVERVVVEPHRVQADVELLQYGRGQHEDDRRAGERRVAVSIANGVHQHQDEQGQDGRRRGDRADAEAVVDAHHDVRVDQE